MGRGLLVLWAGRHRRAGWDAICGRYRERIERFVPLTERAVRAGSGDGRERLAAEAAALRRVLPDPCWTVALDRRGRARSSRQLASWLARLQERWPHPVAFLLGSDLGLDEGLRAQCRDSLSLGPLTLPHELARLVLYEQLYRALSINAGIKYHREPPME
ncbi:MAG: 23S rRNA (pseudouridine(1915)-N(3))-methyltransferase RlmH [Acidobacteriota bacterium]|nr:23S rRNA (pseudouridine(1915)-N(3))-methyltransferase RlmH [Acidobacteriota bacterium]MDH3522554.1 23S rRNA (pseudouridine(1915)-N(3))-methyltransferase RlmH [Acidobacteriota bacterium]